MKTKYEYMKPAIQVLFTQHLMEGEPGIHFASDEIDGNEEGQVLSKEQNFFDVDSVLNKYVPDAFTNVYPPEE